MKRIQSIGGRQCAGGYMSRVSSDSSNNVKCKLTHESYVADQPSQFIVQASFKLLPKINHEYQ